MLRLLCDDGCMISEFSEQIIYTFGIIKMVLTTITISTRHWLAPVLWHLFAFPYDVNYRGHLR